MEQSHVRARIAVLLWFSWAATACVDDLAPPADLGRVEDGPVELGSPADLVTSADLHQALDLHPGPESDCLDGQDDNGDGLVDCDDPSCDSQVECVEKPPGSQPLGVFVDETVDCPSGYTKDTPLRQGLTATGCTGCSCVVETTCNYKLYAYSGNTCGGTVLLDGTNARANDYDNNNDNCAWLAFTTKNVASVRLTYDKLLSSTCAGRGTPGKLPLSWATSRTFCAATIGGGCSFGQRCVAKRAASMCTLAPSAASCDAAYSSDFQIHYQSFADLRTCATCTTTCDVSTPGQCPSSTFPGTTVATDDTICTKGGHQAGVSLSASTVLNTCINVDWAGIYAIHFEPVIGSFGGSCTVDTTATGGATATEPVRVCCK